MHLWTLVNRLKASPKYLKSCDFLRDSLLHLVILRWETHRLLEMLAEAKEYLK